MSDPLISKFVRTIARPVAKSERHRARLHLLDWLACVAGARGSEASEMGSAVSTRGWERATYSGNALGLDDFHSGAQLHPGSFVWPVALSMPSADMDARLDAAVRGYEAMIAIGSALDDYHSAYWDPSATMGVLGACATFGSLIGFAPVEYANALGNAASVAGGLRHYQHDDVLTRQWHVFHAVRTGRDAALHVHYGATGPLAILEGALGLFAAMTREPGEVSSSKSEEWLIHEVSVRTELGASELAASPDTARTIPTEADLIAKMHALAERAQLGTAQADKAVSLSLHESDVDALDTLAEEWTR